MKITIRPTDLEALLAPFYGWAWRADAICYDGCLAVCAETKGLRIARRCPAKSDKSTDSQTTSILINPLYEIAQIGVKSGIWPVVINERIVTLGHATFELEFSRVDMKNDCLVPKIANNWFAPMGKHIDTLSRRDFTKLTRNKAEKQAAVTLGGKAYLLDAADGAALALAVNDESEVRYHQGNTTIYSADCAVRLLTEVLSVDASQACLEVC